MKKETLAQVFSCEFREISKDTFFTEHLWATASLQCKHVFRKSWTKTLDDFVNYGASISDTSRET